MKNEFIPTWLYIKRHRVTGLKYFGKTIRDPVAYKGSGLYWKSHIKKYGNEVDTIWCQLFLDPESLEKYAIEFSTTNSIVESLEWANLKIEDGKMGGAYGEVSTVTRKKISENSKRHKHSEESRKKIKAARALQDAPMLGKKHTADAKKKISESLKSRPKKEKKTTTKTYRSRFGENNSMFGKKHTVETKKKISAVGLGTVWWNNGLIETRSKKDLQKEGWQRGRLTSTQHKKETENF